MAESCLLYYITDRAAFPGDESARRRHLLAKIAEAARAGVNYIQLREKDLHARELESLATEAMQIIQQLRTESRESRTAFLTNSRTDVALAAAADGVHLPSDDISPGDVRAAWHQTFVHNRLTRESSPRKPLIAVSCHSPQEVAQAASAATFAVFGPVFEKKDALGVRATGIDLLRQACAAKIPVLALGGVTLQNFGSCLDAGAAGIAAIRLFQENDIAAIVRRLREH
ncbi:MAG: thiamine phosphate synthase [Candidatus Sulfotelmatobacter sp.]